MSSYAILPYRMSRGINTVTQTWGEWSEGINGEPAVKLLEQQHGAKWRSSPAERKLFSRKKHFIDYIVKEAKDRNCEEPTVVQELDSLLARESLSS